jgi:uncharacterized protein (DUF58 family)
MRRILFMGLLFQILLTGGLFLRNGSLVALSLPFAIAIGLSLAFAPPAIELDVERSLSPARVLPDAPVGVTLHIRNRGRRLEHVLLEDRLPPGLTVVGGASRRLLTLPAGAQLTWEYTLSGPRGHYSFPGLQATAWDPFGLARRREHITTSEQLFIYPHVARLRRVTIRPRQTNVYSGNIPARLGGEGVEFFGVRQYQPGDPPHWINWHASARDPENLFANDYEQERVADVGIILDARLRTNLIQNHSLFDYSITAVSALSEAFLNEGNRVGLLLYGEYLNWIYPGYGRLQRERILHALTRARLGNSLLFDDLAYIPTRLFPPNSQLVLVSPLHEGDLDVLMRLSLRGYQVMVISPDPVSFEYRRLASTPALEQARRILRMERDLLVSRIQRAGMQVINWDLGLPFEQVVYGALSRPRLGLRTIPRGER